MTAPGPRSVVVVGGGVIGLLAAYYLRRDGVDVTVLERDRVGEGCSWGNLGWICPSISVPLPAPGLGKQALSSMLDADSPLHVRPASVPALTPWLTRFWTHCNARDFDRGSAALLALNGRTQALFDELELDGVEFEYASAGLTFVSANRAALDEEHEMIEAVGAAAVERWDADRLAEREPALPAAFAGALHVASDRHVRADSLCAGVAAAIVEAGGTIVEGVEAAGLRTEGSRVLAVEVDEGAIGAEAIDCDAIVLATGAEAGQLAAGLGVRLPVQAGKGYSLSIGDPELRLRRPLYLCDQKVGLTPYDGMLRIGGTMELSGINRRFDRRRVESIRRVVEAAIPGAFDGGPVTAWVGMRPLTPDGLPAIGALPGWTNAFVSTGHQMLGVTLAPASGRELADLMLSGGSSIDMGPFDPRRFGPS